MRYAAWQQDAGNRPLGHAGAPAVEHLDFRLHLHRVPGQGDQVAVVFRARIVASSVVLRGL